MKKKLVFVAITAIVLGLILLVCSYVKMEMVKEKAEGKKVKNAAAICDKLHRILITSQRSSNSRQKSNSHTFIEIYL